MARQTYGYDALGLWVRLSTPDRTHWRYWRAGRVVNELRAANDGGGDVEVTWLTAADGAVAEQVAGPGERSTLLASAPGASVLLEADTNVRPVAYAPHGHRDETAALATPAFNGEWRDAGSGCYLLGPGHHRPYSTTLGIFLAPDTASPFEAGGLNTLAYCVGDPINLSDPSGHFWKWIVAGVGLALGVAVTVASFGAASAAVGAMAAGGIAALTKSGAAAIAGTALGALSVGAEVGAMAAGAAGDQKTAAILGFVGLGLGLAGTAPAVAKVAMKGAARFMRFAQKAMSSRSTAAPLRVVAAGGRGSKAALSSAAQAAAPSSPPSAASWYAAKAPYMSKSSRTFTTYPVSTSTARPAGGRPAFQRQMGVHPDGSDAAAGNAVIDELAEISAMRNWTAPPLKQYPSPAYTTGHLPSGDGARRLVDVEGHLSVMEAMVPSQPNWIQRQIRSFRSAWSNWRDRPPSYASATAPPSYKSLFGE